MMAVSFNRPRDFLSFCYALRARLSEKHPATAENIQAAEIEYTDYFMSEIRDELFLASQVLDFNSTDEDLHKLVDVLARTDGFNSGQLRTDVASILEEKTKTKIGKNRIESFVAQLWWYGILGFKETKDGLINYKYMSLVRFVPQNLDKYKFFLHRGLWWFAQKRKKERTF